jgi:cellulose synthase/poly-beta-1,6-N-acetylglucosamine synthase-like glycosyltransferase
LVQEFTIGICASDSASNLSSLIDLVENESLPAGFFLRRIVLVASGCWKGALDYIKKVARRDNRILIIEEQQRHGKADAVNKIFERRLGDYMIFINSDALPDRGSIGRLLEAASSSESIGITAASPYFKSRNNIFSKLEEFKWSIHNETSLLLNHMNISNHSNDEMMLVKCNLLRPLPGGLVNDGAYIASTVKRIGYSINFCESAKVRIDVPSKFTDIIRQRRRIIFGHLQVWKLVGKSPITVESMFLFAPRVSLKILSRSLRKDHFPLSVLPLAIVSETISILLGMLDFSLSTNKHKVWQRFGS